MTLNRSFRKRWLVRLGFLLPGLTIGCCHTCGNSTFVDRCSDIPPGAIPQPAGAHVNEIIGLQALKAEADDFVIYRNEWYMDGTELGPAGLYHLNQIVKRLPGSPFPVVIQPDAKKETNETRRDIIVRLLMEHGIADAGRLVTIDFPQAEGLFGDEAPRAYRSMLRSGSSGQGNSSNRSSLSGFGAGYGAGGSAGFTGFNR